MRRTAVTSVIRVVALAVLALLHTAWLLADIPWAVKIAVTGLLALAMVRPGQALLVWAGLAPLTTSMVVLAGAQISGGALLEAMTVAVVAGAAMFRSGGQPATRLALPAIGMSAVALASGLAELPARLLASAPDGTSPLAIASLLLEHSVDRAVVLGPWYFAVLVAEGAALAWATESIVRRQPAVIARVVWISLLGHAAVAVLNISRVVGASLRGGDFPASLPGLFLLVRDHTQYDVNAGASVFVVVALAALGLMARRGWLWVALALSAVLTGLWLAGSRVAIIAFGATIAMMLVRRARQSRRDMVVAGATVAALAGVVAWLVFANPVDRNMSISGSFASRFVMAKTALTMAAEAPVMGIGIGTFLDESPHYGATDLAPLVDDRRVKDNAHNYFLQTLGEQGMLGLVALLGMLVAALWPALRGQGPPTAIRTWLAAGVVGSILTWLSGHPLLVPQAALVFWLYVGLLAGTSRAIATTAPRQRWVALAVVALLVSIPFRAEAERRAAVLEHVGDGVSLWQPAVDGERYREAGIAFSLFLPSGTTVILPIRSATTDEVRIELRHESRLFDSAQAFPDVWQSFKIRVPDSPSLYIKIDFQIVSTSAGSPPCQPCAWVGKALPVDSR